MRKYGIFSYGNAIVEENIVEKVINRYACQYIEYEADDTIKTIQYINKCIVRQFIENAIYS